MGLKNNFVPARKLNKTTAIRLEKHLLEKNYSFLKVDIRNDQLKCLGSFTPCEFSKTYIYELKFSPGKPPKVYVIDPKITYHEDIHMYAQDNSLCLYYPGDFSWTDKSHLYNTIIPWTHEWFVFYELYQIYGKWLHPYVSHRKLKP
jgi:hypothetical protein